LNAHQNQLDDQNKAKLHIIYANVLNGVALDFLIFLLIAGGMIALCAWIGAIVLINEHPMLSTRQKIGWLVIATFLPIIGPVAYFIATAQGRVRGSSYRRV
jgi:Na+/H+ antiporter NhaC